jgi:hypothetical protein
VNPDAGLNTIRYMFFHTRCGVWVSIRGNRVVVFTPFANTQYTNTFSGRLKLTAKDLTIGEYAAHKAAVTRRRPEQLIPDTAKWWLNGGIVCNVQPDNVWGPEYLASIRDMLDETCLRHGVPDCDFVVNKRDYPQLRKAVGREPYERYVHTSKLDREVYSVYLPVFSFYTGSDMADLPMPTSDDWALAIGKWLPSVSAGPPAPGVDGRGGGGGKHLPAQVAVFRGTATGAGITPATNVRLRLVEFSKRRPDLVDARLVGFNLRDRVVATSAESITVDFLSDFGRFGPTVPFMSLADQAAGFAYVLYADGHCAASRFGTLLASPMLVLRVLSEHPTTSGHLWLFDYTVGARVDQHGGLDLARGSLHEADHMLVDADLGNMEATVLFLRGNPELAEKIVARAHARAPTAEAITAHWHRQLKWVHELEVESSSPVPGGGCGVGGVGGVGGSHSTREWFSPYEPKYASSSCTFK